MRLLLLALAAAARLLVAAAIAAAAAAAAADEVAAATATATTAGPLPPPGGLTTNPWPSSSPPRVVLTFLMDDLGFYDSSIFNPASVTPTLRSLADDGVRLTRMYAYKYCSPTRRSLLSGRYPIHISGQQAPVCSDYLPLNFTLLSQKLNGTGVESHFLGKGHLGYQTMDHLPINRGFTSHVGFL